MQIKHQINEQDLVVYSFTISLFHEWLNFGNNYLN